MSCERPRCTAATRRRCPRQSSLLSGGGAGKPRANFSAYAACRRPLWLGTSWKRWRSECRQDPIDINSITPGAWSTRMTEEILRHGADAAGEAEMAAARATLKAGRKNFERLGRLVDFLFEPGV